MQQITEFWVM